MKYLRHYQEKAQTELFEKTGAFFAFSQKQFDRAKKDGVKYVSLGAGLICPKNNVEEMTGELENIYKKAISADMEENGKKNIIWRELANHECQISMSTENAIEALKDYPITVEEIKAQWGPYFNHCVENNYF